jgi:acetyl esterase/lipase
MRARQLRDPTELQPIFKAQAPISIADGKDAIGLVRQRAAELGINVDRIGILGFSAGGEVATGAAIGYGVDNRPNFAAPIYGAAADGNIPSDAPPVFIAAAADDPSVPANTSVQLYSRWVAAGRSAELHIYSKGGHGFGMRRQGTPTDGWIDAFYTWLIAEGFAK